MTKKTLSLMLSVSIAILILLILFWPWVSPFIWRKAPPKVPSFSKIDYKTGEEPSSACTADLNGDGLLDLAVANWMSNDVSILLNKGDRTFGIPVNFRIGSFSLMILLV